MRKKSRPPKLFEYFLQMIISLEDRESLVGDFEEMYHRISNENGKVRALCWYLFHIFKLVPSFFKNTIYWSLTMFKNYLKIALRNIIKHKGYSFINIAGLAIGISCCLLIMLYIQYELSYDTYHKNAHRIYKVVRESSYMGTKKEAAVPAPAAPALMDEFPGIEVATRFEKDSDVLIRSGNNKYIENRCIWADKHIFELFTFPLIYGNPKRALENPFSVVIDEETAHKYFGEENPLGKTINIFNKADLQITGVMKNMPKNSHFRTNLFASFETLRKFDDTIDSWSISSYHAYILLKEGTDYRELEKKFPAMFEKYHSKDDAPKIRYYLQPLTDIHLRADTTVDNVEPVSDIKYIYIFSACAFFILLIACVNYMNLAIARSMTRTREVGIRKVVGACRWQLVRQFLGESFFLTLTAFLTAIVLTSSFLGPFANFVEREITIDLIKSSGFLLVLLGTYLFVGIFSGGYPALYVSRFRPVTMLKGAFFRNTKGIFLGNLLVVFQFSISIILIIGTLVISSQLHLIRNKKIGFDREHIIVANIMDLEVIENRSTLKNELLRIPDVRGVTFSNRLPMFINWYTSSDFEGNTKGETGFSVNYGLVDYDFLDLFDMEIAAGRNFSREFAGDATGGGAYILNETAVKRLGWKDPIGKKFQFTWRSIKTMGTVVGVVKDFHNKPLHQPIEPVAFKLAPNHNWANCMAIKVSPGNIPETIAAIEDTWNKFTNGSPFNYNFMDEAYDKMYKSEIQLSTLFRYFSILAIIISCLGLFGLASLTAEQSTKEIGVRKVFGATVQDIVKRLSWKFTKWVVLANIIAWPAAYFAMQNWLQSFAYRVHMGWWTFISVGMLALVIALLTVSVQSIKAASANPVDALKYE